MTQLKSCLHVKGDSENDKVFDPFACPPCFGSATVACVMHHAGGGRPPAVRSLENQITWTTTSRDDRGWRRYLIMLVQRISQVNWVYSILRCRPQHGRPHQRRLCKDAAGHTWGFCSKGPTSGETLDLTCGTGRLGFRDYCLPW